MKLPPKELLQDIAFAVGMIGFVVASVTGSILLWVAFVKVVVKCQ